MGVSLQGASSREVVVEVSAYGGLIAGALLVVVGSLLLIYLPEEAASVNVWIAWFMMVAGIFRLAISRYGTVRLSLDENVVEFEVRRVFGPGQRQLLSLDGFVDARVEESHFRSRTGRSPLRVSLVRQTGDAVPLTSYFDGGNRNAADVAAAIRTLLASSATRRLG